MKHECDRHHRLLERLTLLPQHIVAAHGTANLAEFVLHELCDNDCFELRKAAFFVDNPDFDCLKGVVGIDGDRFKQPVWKSRDAFSDHMTKAKFNNQVRSVQHASSLRDERMWENHAAALADAMEVQRHEWHVCPVKHGNTGMVIFEPTSSWREHSDLLARGVALLALCPIF
jgi:hypothetical protein